MKGVTKLIFINYLNHALLSLIIVLSSIIFFNLSITNFGFSIFALRPAKISELLSQKISNCQEIEDCVLKPGDILIRRHITSRTRILSSLFKMYFTHSAVYFGNGKIIEAVGNEPNKEDEIAVIELVSSDWKKESLESWVILRPRASTTQINAALTSIAKIAYDPDYGFGIKPLNPNAHIAACADLIFNQFKNENIVEGVNSPRIVTPDYLFWYAVKRPDKFEIVGFGLNRQFIGN